MLNHWFIKAVMTAFFFLTVSLTSADDDILSVNAGSDQLVNATDIVHLTGVITFEEDDDDDDDDDDKKDKKKHKKHKKDKKDKHHKKHKKDKKHKDDDDDDEDDDDIVILWVQNSGTPVDLIDVNTLTPHFVAPTPAVSGEILVFTLSVSDDDGDLIASDTVNITVQLPTSTVAGRVTAIDGSIIQGASIDVLSAGTSLLSASSATDGGFSVELASDSDLVLVLTATGFADQVIPVRTPAVDGSIFLDISMIARGATQAFGAGMDTSLTGSDGASVSVVAGSFVDANGTAVTTGNIDLSITPVDVSNPAALAAFPGEFSGILEGDTTDSPIISFGTVEFEFTQNGQPLQLAPGQTADVLIPIYIGTYQNGMPITIGDSIPLWSLNEDTGIWEQEGFGTVVASSTSPTGLAMQATVSHFSWWNCDVSMGSAQAVVTVIGANPGTALIKARTTANIGWRPTTVETVASVGTPTPPLFIPSNGEVCFWAEISFDNGTNGSTLENCITAAPNSVVNVDLVLPLDGPVTIITTPAAMTGVLDIAGFVGFPVERVQLQPSTNETAVTYSIISGTLPPGLSLNAVTAIRAEISGVPTTAGSSSVVVEAVDADGNTDTVTINYNVTTDVPPPDLAPLLVFYSMGMTDLNVFNSGGPVTNWSLSFDPLLEQSPPPAGVSLDASTGILTITGCVTWVGQVNATNSSGTSTATIDIVSCMAAF